MRIPLLATGAILPTGESRQEQLDSWEKKSLPFVVAAALLPMVQIWGGRPDWVTTIILIVSWLVFLVDLAVHMRLRSGYLRTGAGLFDLAIVLLTFPWSLLFPGAAFLDSLVVIRLARLARVLGVAIRRIPQVRKLVARLSNAALYVAIIIAVAAGIVRRVEPESSGFDSYGDAFWWAVVTLTTVGYGDLTPVTTVGRFTGMIVMFVGLAFLGAIAGSLASFFGLGGAGGYLDAGEAEGASAPEPGAGQGRTAEPDPGGSGEGPVIAGTTPTGPASDSL